MDKQSEDQDKVRRLRLPSGKQIEVVVFGATGRRAAAEPEAEKTVAAPSRRLHVCRDCGSNLVHPIDWEEVAADTWRLELRCPNCEWIGGAVYDRGIVELLDDVLDVSGPAERTGKHRGADLLDGTVTLPLILARERDPELAALDPRSVRTPAEAEAVCARVEATGALEEAKRRALAIVAEAKAELPELPGPQREALELVADGVVERYA